MSRACTTCSARYYAPRSTVQDRCSIRRGKRLEVRRTAGLYVTASDSAFGCIYSFRCTSRAFPRLSLYMYRHSWILCKRFWSDCWLSPRELGVSVTFAIFLFAWSRAKEEERCSRDFLRRYAPKNEDTYSHASLKQTNSIHDIHSFNFLYSIHVYILFFSEIYLSYTYSLFVIKILMQLYKASLVEFRNVYVFFFSIT